MTIATLAPELLRGADTPVGMDATNVQVAALSTSVTKISSQVATLQDKQSTLDGSVGAVSAKVSDLQTKVASIDSLDHTITTRLTALESGSPSAPEARAPGGAGVTATPPLAIDSRPAAGNVPQIDGVVVPADPSLDSTGGATAAAVTKKPVKTAASDAKPRPYALDLAAVSTSNQALAELWGVLKDQHADLLSGLSPRAVTSGSNVRLIAGPFASQAAAAAACAKFRAQGVPCTPTPLAGTPL